MGVGLITKITNNSNQKWYIMSEDSANNGKINGTIELNGGEWHEIPKGTSTCDWCGIPWIKKGKSYKGLSCDSNKEHAVRIFQSENDGKNWIYYKNFNTGDPLARQQISDDNYEAELVIPADINKNPFQIVTGYNGTTEIREGGVWIKGNMGLPLINCLTKG